MERLVDFLVSPELLSVGFMFPVPLASLDAREICSEISQAGMSRSAQPPT